MPKNSISEGRREISSSVAPKNRSPSKKASSRSTEAIKLRRIVLTNFKAFDHLELEFPEPRMKDDPDVFVMGSENGLGKTSVLEACSMLFLGAALNTEDILDVLDYRDPVDFMEVMIRAGSKKTSIEGTFTVEGKTANVMVSLSGADKIKVQGNTSLFRRSVSVPGAESEDKVEALFRSLGGFNPEPLVLPPLMYLHSYRKVQEGSMQLGTIVEEYGRTGPLGTFKIEILRAMMSRGGLFEDPNGDEAEIILEMLDQLMVEYAGGRVGKLRPSSDNTIEFRVTPADGRASFTFDGLSSGQKEIISTLFLIWRYTRTQPGIILIDEPELHLNPEWHRGFVRRVHKLAPHNQYIIATHSEDVFSSVDEDRRILLEREG